MKHILPILFFAIIASSCSDDSAGGGIPASGTVKLKLDGVSWQATGANAGKVTSSGVTAISCSGVKLVSGSQNETFTVTIYSTVGGSVTPGTYNEQNTMPSIDLLFQDVNRNSWVSTTGSSITVTKVSDTNIQGTFSGTLLRNGHPDKVVTDGGFNCNIFSF